MLHHGDAYTQDIDKGICRAIGDGVNGFTGFITALPGVYPADVLASLRRLASLGRLDNGVLERAQAEAAAPPVFSEAIARPFRLPVPHPLDFAWRFGDQAVARLWDACLGATHDEETIILLGLPRMLTAEMAIIPSRRVILVDADPVVVKVVSEAMPSAEMIEADLTTDLNCERRGDVIVADPPWYPEYMRSFLWAARQACSFGGSVFLCFPPSGTRPGVAGEWHDLVRWAGRLGMCVRNVDHQVLPYVSPLFERNALAAVGVTNYPEEWRCGDLVTFAVTGECQVERPPLPEPMARWEERIIGEVRLRVRNGQGSEFADPTLRQLVPGDVLPSVSRRDRRRRLVGVWTCGNRVFTCGGRGVLLMIMDALGRSVCPADHVAMCLDKRLSAGEVAAIRCSRRQVEELVMTESQEIDAFYRE